MRLRLQTAVAVVYSVGSSAVVPCLGVLASQAGMGLRLGFQRGIHRSLGSWAAVGIAVVALAVGAIAPGPEVGNAAVRAAAHIVVSQAAVRSDAVWWCLRLEEVDSVVAGARGEKKAVVGRIGRREGARSTVVGVAGLKYVRRVSIEEGLLESELEWERNTGRSWPMSVATS